MKTVQLSFELAGSFNEGKAIIKSATQGCGIASSGVAYHVLTDFVYYGR